MLSIICDWICRKGPYVRSIKSFLPPFYPWRYAREKGYQALCVLRATEKQCGPGNETSMQVFFKYSSKTSPSSIKFSLKTFTFNFPSSHVTLLAIDSCKWNDSSWVNTTLTICTVYVKLNIVFLSGRRVCQNPLPIWACFYNLAFPTCLLLYLAGSLQCEQLYCVRTAQLDLVLWFFGSLS